MDSLNEVLDLRLDGQLSSEHSKLFDSLIENCIDDFNHFNEELININNLAEIDLFLSISSRDTSASKIFDYLSRINLFKHLYNENSLPKEIITSNIELKNIIENFLKSKSVKNINITCNKKHYYFIRIFKNIFVSLYLFLNGLIFSRILGIKKIPSKEIVFIDTFIIKDSFNTKGAFVDRYYSGMEDYLSFTEKEVMWFFPTLVDLKSPLDFYRIFKSSKETNINFLFEESFISIKDFFHGMVSSIISFRKIKKIPKYNDLDVSTLIKRECYKDIFSPSFQKSFYKYILIKKLENYKIKLKGVINWFENQTIDRALVLGFKKYYPKIKIKGYQSYFFPKFDLHKNPTNIEIKRKTIPDTIYVISQDALKDRSKHFKSLNLKIAPGLRFEYVNKIIHKKTDEEVVFVPLSIDINQCKQLINFTKQAKEKFFKNSSIIYKHHPKFTKKEFFKFLPEAKDKSLFFSSESSERILSKSSMIISSASSLCVEAVSLGIPVAILANNNGFTKSPLPEAKKNDIWCIFYSEEDFEIFLNKTKVSFSKEKYNFFKQFSSNDVRDFFFEFK